MERIRLLLLFLIFSFQPVALAGPIDEHLLIGTWSRSTSKDGQLLYEEQSYLPDGTFCSITLDTSNQTHVVRHRVGTWSLYNGVLGVSVSSATDPKDLVIAPLAEISHIQTLSRSVLVTGIDVTDVGFFPTRYTKVQQDRGRQLCEL